MFVIIDCDVSKKHAIIFQSSNKLYLDPNLWNQGPMSSQHKLKKQNILTC